MDRILQFGPEGLTDAGRGWWRSSDDHNNNAVRTTTQHERTEEELRDLEERLRRLRAAHPLGSKGFTNAGIRKMIDRLHQELVKLEGSEEARQTEPS